MTSESLFHFSYTSADIYFQPLLCFVFIYIWIRTRFQTQITAHELFALYLLVVLTYWTVVLMTLLHEILWVAFQLIEGLVVNYTPINNLIQGCFLPPVLEV